MKVIDAHRMQNGLLPIYVHKSGRFPYHEIRLGNCGDFYYGKHTTIFYVCAV
jgi:hypothetical protein